MSIADKLSAIAENEQKVYDAGKQAEYDDFWDSLQSNGNRTNYNRAFFGWTEECFQPKYPIVSSNGVTTLQETVAYGTVEDTKVPIIAAYASNVLNGTFAGSHSLHTIHSLEVNAGIKYTNTFGGCESLVNLTMAGEIGQNGFDVSACTLLSKASITSIINCLSTTTSGLTVTLSQTAVDNAFTTDDWNTLVATRTNWTITLS